MVNLCFDQYRWRAFRPAQPAWRGTCHGLFMPALWLARLTGAAYRGGMTAHIPLTLALQPGGVCSLRNMRDTVVIVQAGRIWLTQTGSLDDHFLASGQQHHVARSAQVVVQCLGSSPAHIELQQRFVCSAALGDMT